LGRIHQLLHGEKSEPWEEGKPDISNGGAQRRYERGWENPVKETKREAFSLRSS